MIGRSVSHYRIVSRLGAGGMGVVYKAEDLRLGRFVTLKFLNEKHQLNPQALERFELETQAISTLNHPNICTIHDVDRDGEHPFIVMEFLEGKNLRDLLRAETLEPERILEIGIQVTEGLQEAHSKGIVHRDIKPSNIMITRAGHAKILDFGLAKLMEWPQGPHSDSSGLTVDPITRDGAMVGTINYMSPEQALGKPVDGRSDLFSVGVVLYEMATGQPPFQGATQAAFFEELIHRSPVPALESNPVLPQRFGPILDRLLQKEPNFRYQTAKDLRADLANLKRQITLSNSPLPVSRPVRPRSLLKYLLRIPVMAVLGLALFYGAVSFPTDDLKEWVWGVEISSGRHLAVLPFSALGSGTEEDRILCLGLTEDLTTALVQLTTYQSEFLILPSEELRSRNVRSARELFKTFGVGLAVACALEFSRNQEIVLHLELIDARKLITLERESITNSSQERSLLTEAAVRALSRMLQLTLSEQDHAVLMATRAQVSDSVEIYMRGLGLLRNHVDHHDLSQAISYLSEAVSLDPEYLPAGIALAQAHLALFLDTRQVGSLENAEEICLKVQERSPDSAELLATLGSVYSERGQFPEAEGLLRQSLRLFPNNPSAKQELARVLDATGRSQQAEALFREAIERWPDDWVGYRELAKFYASRARFEEAITTYARVVELNPESSVTYANLGAMNLFNGNLSEASAMLRLSIQMNPTDYAYANLGTALFYSGRLEEAAEALERALEIDATDHRLWANLAGFYKRLGDRERMLSRYAEAISQVDRLLRINPGNVTYQLDKADYLINSEQPTLGLSLLDEIGLRLRDSDRSSEMYLVGQVYEDAGMRAQAIEWTVAAIRAGYPLDSALGSSTLEELVKDPEFLKQIDELGLH
ncbi:MAG: protein kinase [Acidobacteriota bacterium]|nr:MAG: protein kinase [Acidobacteriota bacterium]